MSVDLLEHGVAAALRDCCEAIKAINILNSSTIARAWICSRFAPMPAKIFSTRLTAAGLRLAHFTSNLLVSVQFQAWADVGSIIGFNKDRSCGALPACELLVLSSETPCVEHKGDANIFSRSRVVARRCGLLAHCSLRDPLPRGRGAGYQMWFLRRLILGREILLIFF